VKRKPLETDCHQSPLFKKQLTQAAAADLQSFVRRHSFVDYLQGGESDTTFDASELSFPDGDIDGDPMDDDDLSDGEQQAQQHFCSIGSAAELEGEERDEDPMLFASLSQLAEDVARNPLAMSAVLQMKQRSNWALGDEQTQWVQQSSLVHRLDQLISPGPSIEV
jgi:hypothetical protein